LVDHICYVISHAVPWLCGLCE